MHTITKRKLFAGLFSLALLFSFALPVGTQAQDPDGDPFGIKKAKEINVGDNTDLKGVVADVVNIVLGFLGIIAVVIILYAGLKWMTAAGNEEAVGDAKKMLVQAIIGIAIVFLAWAISSFVISSIGSATNTVTGIEEADSE